MKENFSAQAWDKISHIVPDFLDGFEQLEKIGPAISIFGSSRINPDHPYYIFAEELAYKLALAGFSIITGGGGGLMEACNKGAKRGGTLSIGLNISLPHEKAPNPFQDLSLSFNNFFSRKVMFVKFASAYIILPGGYGTLDELAEVLTLIQTKQSRKLPIIMCHRAFWQNFLNWLNDTMVAEGTIHTTDLELIQIIEDIDQIVAYLCHHCSSDDTGMSHSLTMTQA